MYLKKKSRGGACLRTPLAGSAHLWHTQEHASCGPGQNHRPRPVLILNQDVGKYEVLSHHYISMPYGPNLANKCVVPYVCLLPCLRTSLTELDNIHGVTHATIKVTVQSEHEPYRSNGDTFDTNPLRIMRATLRNIQ